MGLFEKIHPTGDTAAAQAGWNKLLKPRAYHIPQGAIDVCNRLGKEPADAIVWLDGELARRGRTLDISQQVEDAFRKVVLVEGVNLSPGQKAFFRDLFSELLRGLRDGAP